MIVQPSFQTFDLDGMITDIMPGYCHGQLAKLRVIGLKGLIVPIDEADQFNVGDIISILVCIDKVTNMSRAYRLDQFQTVHG